MSGVTCSIQVLATSKNTPNAAPSSAILTLLLLMYLKQKNPKYKKVNQFSIFIMWRVIEHVRAIIIMHLDEKLIEK